MSREPYSEGEPLAGSPFLFKLLCGGLLVGGLLLLGLAWSAIESRERVRSEQEQASRQVIELRRQIQKSR